MKTLAEIKLELESLAADIRAHEDAASAQGYQGVPYYLREVGQDLEHASLGLRHAIDQSSADALAYRQLQHMAAAFDLLGAA